MKKLMKISVLGSALALALSASVMAKTPAPNFDFVEVGYIQLDIDDSTGIDLDGYTIEASKSFANDFFISGNYYSVGDSPGGFDFDFEGMELNLGYQYGMTKSTSLYGSLDYYDLTVTGPFFNGNGIVSRETSDDRFGVTAGVRSFLTDNIELDAAVSYIDADDSEINLTVGAQYYINKNFSLGARYRDLDGADSLAVTARYNF